jgi:hypothetical protein
MNNVIVILGMDRSGTALLCQLLERMGAWFGHKEQLVGPSSINERGHYEYIPFARVQEQLLKNVFNVTQLFKGSLPGGWHRQETIEMLYKEALKSHLSKAMIEAKLRCQPFAFKDTRTTRLLPLWADIFEELDTEPTYVETWRNPQAVYMSIHPGTDAIPSKDVQKMHFHDVGIPSLPESDVLAVWKRCQMEIRQVGAEQFCFDDWFEEGPAKYQMVRLADFVGLPALSDNDMREIIRPELRHVRWA